MPEYPAFIGVNSTGKITWILGFLHSVFNYWTQFYNSTRNHAYMPWQLWLNSTRKIKWFVGILACNLSLQFYKKTHTRAWLFKDDFNSTQKIKWICGIFAFLPSISGLNSTILQEITHTCLDTLISILQGKSLGS